MNCVWKNSAWLLLLFWVGTLSYARAPMDAEISAAGVLADDISDWINQMTNRPKSIAIFSVYAQEPLEQDYSDLMESEILKRLTRGNFDHVSSCFECRTPQIFVEGEALFIRKGIPDAESLKRLSERHPVESYLMVEIYRTKFSVVAQASVYQNNTGTLLGMERFSASALAITDTEVQLLITLGAGTVSGGTTTGSGLKYAGQIMLVEELGFGKGGLSIGAVLGNQTLIYVNPTLAFYKDIVRKKLNLALVLGGGFGFAGSTKGFTARSSLEFFIGSFTILGLDVNYFLPETATTGVDTLYLGGHLGISFGR